MDCVFCKIVRGEEPAYIVYEDEYVVAILDKYPVNKGHTLVMPKRHYRDITEIPDEELCRVIKITKAVTIAVMRALKVPGVRVVQNNGAEAGQVIFHIHFHVIPMTGHISGRHYLTDEEGREVSSVLSREIKEVLNDL
ncbi:MAG: HIT family protein [Vulcanisaeta sp.]|jgi:Diadenosine tetraphosphate (Ap4A) hydrolase and other HIT family hydrolases|nr:MAG: HIT family hydrolase [Vulcanisaeta sp. MG_3]KUO93905.1 MAG: HIT family hydrolase [Vulcanisaeta sp. CIS_19]MCG2865494.1 HIT family protein [Vulcanisaeta sp.]MCG2870461.1 HIT family protein [Vulcanisaeta sp.]MCG2886079.1 HIT family protein [Vulcanisaeta sp.]